MFKWIKNAWPWKSKSMTQEEILNSWAQYINEEPIPIKNLSEKAKPALKKATTRSKTMPLVKSASKKAVGKNIKIEEKAGKPKKQALAIALSVQDKAKSTKKGKK